MLAIVIDTSCAAVTAAVVRFDEHIGGGRARGAGPPPQVVAERVTVDARAHAELLAPSIVACLDEAGATTANVGAVVAGLGPGPFTGLRVGLVTAAALADALQVPSYGVCSLDAIAAELTHPEPLLVAGDARRREVYWATYGAGFPGGGVRLAGPDVARAADVPRADVTAMAGAGARLYQEQLGLPLLERDYPTARGLARLAADRVLAGAPSETLVPLYLRRPDAVAATSFKAVTPLTGAWTEPMPVVLRPMVTADIDRIMVHEDALFGPEAWTPDSYRAELADRRYRHYLIAQRAADTPQNVVGWAGLMVIAETAQILTIGVVTAAQGHGIGQTMLDGLLAEARRRGATEVVLEVRVDNAAARRLYERNRFRTLRVRRGYYDLGRVDALEMKREL